VNISGLPSLTILPAERKRTLSNVEKVETPMIVEDSQGPTPFLPDQGRKSLHPK
jgi:hypothetical protein